VLRIRNNRGASATIIPGASHALAEAAETLVGYRYDA